MAFTMSILLIAPEEFVVAGLAPGAARAARSHVELVPSKLRVRIYSDPFPVAGRMRALRCGAH